MNQGERGGTLPGPFRLRQSPFSGDGVFVFGSQSLVVPQQLLSDLMGRCHLPARLRGRAACSRLRVFAVQEVGLLSLDGRTTLSPIAHPQAGQG